MKSVKTMIETIPDMQQWIIDSEMGGKLDKTDPFYPIYVNLTELESKMKDEIDLETWKQKQNKNKN